MVNEEESGPYNGIGRGNADRRSTEIDGRDWPLNAPGEDLTGEQERRSMTVGWVIPDPTVEVNPAAGPWYKD